MSDSKPIMWVPPLKEPRALQGMNLGPAPSSLPSAPIHPATISPPKTVIPFQVIPEDKNFKDSDGSYILKLRAPSFWMLGVGLMLLGGIFFLSGLLIGYTLLKPSRSAVEKMQSDFSLANSGQDRSSESLSPGKEKVFMGGLSEKNASGMAKRALQAMHEVTGGVGRFGRVVRGANVMVNSGNPPRNDAYVREPEFGGSNPAMSSPSMSSMGYSQHGVGSGAAGNGKVYCVQLGAFVTKENAIELVQRMESRSVPAVIEEGIDSMGAPLFYVRTGHYKSFQEAQAQAEAISQCQRLSAIAVDSK